MICLVQILNISTFLSAEIHGKRVILFASSITLKTNLLFLSHYRILYGVPVEKQKYSSVSPVPPEEFPELVQTSQWQAHQPDLQISGEEVRIPFNTRFLYLVCL